MYKLRLVKHLSLLYDLLQTAQNKLSSSLTTENENRYQTIYCAVYYN